MYSHPHTHTNQDSHIPRPCTLRVTRRPRGSTPDSPVFFTPPPSPKQNPNPFDPSHDSKTHTSGKKSPPSSLQSVHLLPLQASPMLQHKTLSKLRQERHSWWVSRCCPQKSKIHDSARGRKSSSDGATAAKLEARASFRRPRSFSVVVFHEPCWEHRVCSRERLERADSFDQPELQLQLLEPRVHDARGLDLQAAAAAAVVRQLEYSSPYGIAQ